MAMSPTGSDCNDNNRIPIREPPNTVMELTTIATAPPTKTPQLMLKPGISMRMATTLRAQAYPPFPVTSPVATLPRPQTAMTATIPSFPLERSATALTTTATAASMRAWQSPTIETLTGTALAARAIQQPHAALPMAMSPTMQTATTATAPSIQTPLKFVTMSITTATTASTTTTTAST